MSTDRTESLESLLKNESPEQLTALVNALRSGKLNLESRRTAIGRELGPPPDSLNRIFKVFETWGGDTGIGPVHLADIIDVAALPLAQVSVMPRAELVWTGPDGGQQTARKTFQVINEMLRQATDSVLIVGYSLFLKGELARDLVGRLSALSSLGVDVVFIVDRRYRGYANDGQEGHSVREIQQMWPRNARRPSIYSWSSDEEPSSKLHAKVLLIDSRDLLVTSANLTGAGMETNLELGVRLQGVVASSCSEHFLQLLNAGFFVEESWP
jgi:phosphatidylserine/phosphatidylglycerophosphate/cardiolipin synthase-like enzyme